MPFIVPWINAVYSRLLSRPSQVIALSDRVFTFPCVVRNDCAEWAAPRYTILWILFICILRTWRKHKNYLIDTQAEQTEGFWLLILHLNYYMRSSYRSSRLGLSHWDPYAMHRGGCLGLYYCNMAEWCWWDSRLICKINWFPSVLWHCWLGPMTCKNRPRYDL